jgi:hypothetical protein
MVGIVIGVFFSLFQFGLAHDVIGSDPFHHLVDVVTFFAPMLTFTIAISACSEQVLLHHKMTQEGRFRSIFILNILTAALVSLACSSLVRLDLAAITKRAKRFQEVAVAQPAGIAQLNGNQPLSASDNVVAQKGISDGLNVCRSALRQWFGVKTSAELYDPRIHLAITFFLFVLFCIWDFCMRGLSLDANVKQEIRAASLALNVPTSLGLLGMLSLAVFGFAGLSRPEQDAFIGGIIAFHLAFAAIAFLLSVILPSGKAVVVENKTSPPSAPVEKAVGESPNPPSHS